MKLVRIPAHSFLDYLRPKRCDICGKYPFLPYLDTIGNKACYRHQKEGTLGHCAFCGRFCLLEQTQQISNTMYCCSRCNSDIPGGNELGKIALSIRTSYREWGLGELPRFWVNQVSYDKLPQRDGRVILAYAVPRPRYYDLYLFNGLSRTIYKSTLAHEVLHLWLWEHHLDPAADLREGFCNLGAYLIMKVDGTEDSRIRMRMLERDPDPIYGGGFRKLKAIFDKRGWKAVIDFLHNEKL